MTHWTLRTTAPFRRRAVLEHDGREVGTLRRGVRGSRFASGTTADGAIWTVVRQGERLEISDARGVRATVDGSDLVVDGRTFAWRLPEDGSREAQVTASGAADDTGPRRGAVVLRIRPPQDRDDDASGRAPWAVVEVDETLPQAFGLAVAACARLLQIGGSGRWTPPKTGMPSSPTGSDNGDNRTMAVRYGPGA